MELEDEADAAAAEGCKFAAAEREDVRSVDEYSSAVRGGEGAEYLEEGGFACAGCSGDCDHFSFSGGKVHSAKNLECPEGFADAVGTYDSVSCHQNKVKNLRKYSKKSLSLLG